MQQWGGWTLFQELLVALRNIANHHRVSIANVATRAILDKPARASEWVGRERVVGREAEWPSQSKEGVPFLGEASGRE